MLDLRQKFKILNMKELGYSNKAIAEEIGISRTTVIKYLKRDQELNEELRKVEQGSVEFHQIVEEISGSPQYKGKYGKRMNRKYTQEMDDMIEDILKDEKRKDKVYGRTHKLRRTALQIYELLVEAGFDISYSTINNKVSEKRRKHKEAYIKQHYEYGQRAEFDFGERNITIGGKVQKVFVAVICLPKSGYRDYYIYNNAKNEVFVDSQVRFFEDLDGVPYQMVYDNMKNVVKRFVGKNERELTDTVLSLSNYYKFDILVTNPYSGNEKGSVERSVGVIANDLFANRDVFEDWDDLLSYAQERKAFLNRKADIEEEKKYLKKTKPPYEAAKITSNKVSKYCFVRVDYNDYSVPEHYSGQMVTVKTYPHSIEVWKEGTMIAQHRRKFGKGETTVKIEHYLRTMLRKPGSTMNSVALAQSPKLKNIFEEHYTDKPREFLEILIDNKDLMDTEELYSLLAKGKFDEDDSDLIEQFSVNQLESLDSMFKRT